MDTHEQTFSRLMYEFLPGQIADLERKVAEREKHFGAMSSDDKDDYGGLSYFHSTNLLNAVLDSLRTLNLLVQKNENAVVINVTHNGIAGLLREALEAIAIYQWLNESSDGDVVQRRGFSITLVDLEERGKYYRDLVDTENIEANEKMVAAQIVSGKEKGYLEERENKLGKKVLFNREGLPDSISLCKKLKTPDDLIKGLILEMYPGMENASWLFRWLSGLTHGKHWVNKYIGNEDGTSSRKVNYMLLNIAIMTIINALGKVTT